MMMPTSETVGTFLLTYPVFLLALTIHEFAHAVTAKWGGDLTAAYQGRVSLSPLTHIDPIGTVLMPIVGSLGGLPVLGWARPVPVVETNYRRGSGYGLVVVMAGPFSNLIQALFFAVLGQVFLLLLEPIVELVGQQGMQMLWTLVYYGVFINVVLFFFNLLPIPPLDGSHVLWHLVIKDRPHLHGFYDFLWRAGFMLLIVLLLSGAFRWYIETFANPIVNALVVAMQWVIME